MTNKNQRASNSLVGAVEAGGTKFLCAVGKALPDFFDTANRIEIPTKDAPHLTIKEVISWFRRAEIDHDESISAFGIMSFGPICLHLGLPQYGYITSTPKIGWSNFNLLHPFKEHFPNARIVFDTDVNGAAFGEYVYGYNKKIKNLLYITIGTGIGAGAVVNGKILHGADHPEMGHMRVPRICGDVFKGTCIFHGDCWEGLCSGPAMLQRTGISAENLPPDHPAWEYEAQYISHAIANLVYTLSPEIIVLGGSVSKGGNLGQRALFQNINTKVAASLGRYLSEVFLDEKKEHEYIVPPKLGASSAILGALAMVTSKH